MNLLENTSIRPRFMKGGTLKPGSGCTAGQWERKIITFRIENDANTQQEEDHGYKDNYQQERQAAVKASLAARRLVSDDLYTGGLPETQPSGSQVLH